MKHNILNIILIFLCFLFFINLQTHAKEDEKSKQILTFVNAGISDKNPKQNSTIKAYCEAKDQNKEPILGAKCKFKWLYKTTTPSMTALTKKNGKAIISRKIGRASKNKKVKIIVTITYNEISKIASTEFTPK